ncbi:MAG: hypothetical protein MI975_08760 [Cytophagales bacterium]|nr:hypothetical protein [Cytophagales bacterium]
MKTHFLFIICALLLDSCIQPKYYQQRINDIPASAPNFGVEIRFAGDSLPSRPYFEVIDFELFEKGTLGKEEIKARLEIEAIKEGVDMVVNVDMRNEMAEESNLFTILVDAMVDDGETTTVPAHYTHITGLGIIFLESLDYIHSIPEFEYFYEVDLKTDFPKPFIKIEYKLTGQEFMVYPESEDALEIYKKYFQFYSDFHLLRQREMWTYKMKEGRLKKRILRNEGGFITKMCMPEYNDKGKIVRLNIMNRSRKIYADESIHYSYNEKGDLANRLVETYDGTKVYEEYLYEADRLTGKKILLNLSSGKQIHLNSSIQYYAPDYLKDLHFYNTAQQD